MNTDQLKLAAIPVAIIWLVIAVPVYRHARERMYEENVHSNNVFSSLLLAVVLPAFGIIVVAGFVALLVKLIGAM